jgi:hypothetical protein
MSHADFLYPCRGTDRITKNSIRMKNTIIKSIAMTGLIAVGLLTGCAKDGAPGPAGTNGTNGNANVIGTNTLTLSNPWTYNASDSSYSYPITAPGITPAVITNGFVGIYFQSANGWIPLPVSHIFAPHDFMTFEMSAGTVTILYVLGGAIPLNPTSNNIVVRCIIIPASAIKPNVNMNNYNDVKSAYKLKD